MSNIPSSTKTSLSSSKCKSVLLHDWWLTQVEDDSKLGVGGFFNRETLQTRGMRLLGSASIGRSGNRIAHETGIQVFGSAAITKRHDNKTLEAADGIMITISGCINGLRTQQNGFSPEICNHFISGFPWNWQDCAANAKPSLKECADTTKRFSPVSFSGLPVTHVRDLLISATGETETRAFTSIIFRDILKQCRSNSLTHEEDDNSLENIDEEAQTNHLLHEVHEILEETKDGSVLTNSTKVAQMESPLVSNMNLDAHCEFGASSSFSEISHKSPVKTTGPFSTPLVSRCSPEMIRKEHDTSVTSGSKRKVMKSQEGSTIRGRPRKVSRCSPEMIRKDRDTSLTSGSKRKVMKSQEGSTIRGRGRPRKVSRCSPEMIRKDRDTSVTSGSKRKVMKSQGGSTIRRSARVKKQA